jgi:hypothetical protein
MQSMQAESNSKRFLTPLVVLTVGLAVPAVIWPGCTIFFAPLSASAGPDAAINVGQSVVLQGSAAGGSGQYSFSWSPTTGLNDATADRPVFTPTTVGTSTFTLTVTDSVGNTATDTVTVAVTSVSPPLVASAGPDLTGEIGAPVILQGSATGGSGHYAYAWTAPAGVTLAGANTATPMFTPASVGAFTFTLKVTDTEAVTATDEVVVAVTNATTLSSLTWGADVSTGGYKVLAVFSQALAKSSAETVSNYRVTGTSTAPISASLASDGKTVTLTFNVALASTSQFDLSVGGRLMDASGNSVAAVSGLTPDPNSGDTTPPAIISKTWGAALSNGYQLAIVFSQALDKTSAQTTTAYRVHGTTTAASSATLGTDGKTVTVVFTGVTLTSSSTIDISVGDAIRDINGNALSVQVNQTISGTIGGTTTVSSVNWGAGYGSGGYQVIVVFSGAVDETTAETVAYWRINGTSTNPASATLGSDGKTGSAIKDSGGIAISEKLAQTISAASGDTTAPNVSSVTWAANYSSGGYQIAVVYNEAMDRASVQATTSWRINGTTTTPSSVTLGTDGKTVTLVFLAALAISDRLDISVSSAIRDINGNAQSQSLSQAIAAATETTLPAVSAVNWAAHYGAGGYQVLVAFSEALDRTSAQTLANYAINPGAVAPTTATLRTDGKTVELVFAGALRHPADTLDISIGATVKDINGNTTAALAAQAIAANTADTTGPNIASRFWKAGVPTYQAVVTFSDAMDEASAETVGNYSMTVNGGAAINPTTATLAVDGVTVTLDFGAAQAFKTSDQLTVAAAVHNVNNRANTSTAATAMTTAGGTRAAAASYVWVAPPASYQITLTFAEVMDITSATTLANYTLGAALANPNTATLAADGVTATLTWTTGAFAVTDQLGITSGVKNIRGESKAETVAVASGGGAGPTITSRIWGANQTTYKAIVLFSQVMDKTSAETPGNYNLGGAVGTAASLAVDGKTVTVTFGTGTLNAADSLTVAGAVHNINAVANTSVAAVAMAVNPADITAPIPQTAAKVDATHVDITFNEVVDRATAEAAAYTITGGAVTAAVMQAGGLKVRLTTTVDPTTQTVTVPATVTDVNTRTVAAPTPLLVSG